MQQGENAYGDLWLLGLGPKKNLEIHRYCVLSHISHNVSGKCNFLAKALGSMS